MSDLDDVNTVEQTAAYLKIEVQALRRFANAGKIGSLKQGRTLTFTREAIEAYVESNTKLAAPANPWALTDASLRKIRRA